MNYLCRIFHISSALVTKDTHGKENTAEIYKPHAHFLTVGWELHTFFPKASLYKIEENILRGSLRYKHQLEVQICQVCVQLHFKHCVTCCLLFSLKENPLLVLLNFFFVSDKWHIKAACCKKVPSSVQLTSDTGERIRSHLKIPQIHTWNTVK